MVDVKLRPQNCFELELERVRKFSIFDCVRKELEDVINKLPTKFNSSQVLKEIDGVIRRNLVCERKVRFGSAPEIDASKNESEKNALEEIEMTLKILGNDRRNKLIIENFGFLEERLKSVEQRMSNLIRKKSFLPSSQKIPIKIDQNRVKSQIQEFVNNFNNAFTSTYEILSNNNVNVSDLDESLTSTNRLKFHLLSNLCEKNKSKNSEEGTFNTGVAKKDAITKNSQVAEKKATTLSKNKLIFKSIVSNQNELKSAGSPLVKTVDSLRMIRQRFKSQSEKWLQMKLGDKANELEEKLQINFQLRKMSEQPNLTKKNDFIRSNIRNLSENSNFKSSAKINKNFASLGGGDILDSEYIGKVLNNTLKGYAQEMRTNKKKSKPPSPKPKKISFSSNAKQNREQILNEMTKTQAATVVPNARARLSKIPTKLPIPIRNNSQISPPKYTPLTICDANTQSKNKEQSLPPLGETSGSVETDELSKIEFSDNKVYKCALIKSKDETSKSENQIDVKSEKPQETNNTRKWTFINRLDVGSSTNDTTSTTVSNESLHKISNAPPKHSETGNNRLLREMELLDDFIAGISEKLSKENKASNSLVSLIQETKEGLLKVRSSMAKKETEDDFKNYCSPPNRPNSLNTKDKFQKLTQKRGVLPNNKSAKIKELKKVEKHKIKNQLIKIKNFDAQKSEKTKFNTIKKQHDRMDQPSSGRADNVLIKKLRENLMKQSFKKNLMKKSENETDVSVSSIDEIFRKSSSLSTEGTNSKSSISMMSELKLKGFQRNFLEKKPGNL